MMIKIQKHINPELFPKMTLILDIVQCYYNNRGFCKHGENCRYQHFQEPCPNRFCKDKQCKFRHPRPCKHEKSCKFYLKGICSYRHDVIKSAEELTNSAKMKKYVKIKKNDLLMLLILGTKLKNLKRKIRLLSWNIRT